jgi:hypothetical protein
MKRKIDSQQSGNGLVVTLSVVATILALLGAAVSYTSHISRLSQRSRRIALAMEIADGHLEYLFTNWRSIYRNTWTTYGYASGGTDYSVVGTNYFYTDMYNPSNGCSACATPSPVPNMTPSGTPPQIGLPPTSYFPTEPNYTVSQYRIQAVDPMVDLDASGNALQETSWGSGTYTSLNSATAPPPAFGPNTWQYSYFYLAAVDASVPALGTNTGTVTAKVRRVFEKKFDSPWTYAMLYMDDLEFQPSSAFAINGPIQANGSLYIGTSNFTAQDRVGYGGDYVNGYSPNDTSHSGGSVTAPNFPASEPPSQVSPFLPFGWNVALSTTDTNPNNDSYHDIIERPNNSYSDGLANIRYYNQADYRILIDANNNVTITDYTGTAITSGSTYNQIVNALATNQVIQDNREATFVRLTTLDVNQLTSAMNKLPAWNHTGTGGGIIYISDTSAGTAVSCTLNGNTVSTIKRGIRIKNGSTLPSGGMTVVAENPVYIQGDYNTGGSNPPSNSGTYTDPDVSGYTRRYAAIVGDAITVLSSGWSDANSDKSISSRVATNTTVNAALVTGQVPSGGGFYSGGGENFVRFLEDWQKNSNTFTYYGSMVELFNSQQGTGKWQSSSSVYKAPGLHWYYDTNFQVGAPPGTLQIAAYLQQQRWYQVY